MQSIQYTRRARHKKVIASALSALCLFTAPMHANASQCLLGGCSVADDPNTTVGPGDAVYLHSVTGSNTKLLVVRRIGSRYFVQDRLGRQYWVHGSSIFTQQRVEERDRNTAIGALGFLLMLAGSAAGDGGLSVVHGGSDNNANSDTELQRHYQSAPSNHYEAKIGDAYRNDTSAGCAWGDRALGTCH